MARHLREQSGGNPADHGPVRELANRPASPRSNEDFPDAPGPGERSGPGGDLSDEQRRDFAIRLGLGDDAAGDDAAGDREQRGGRARRGDAREERAADSAGTGPSRGARRRVTQVVIRGVRRPVATVLIVVSRGVGTTGRWLHSAGERIAPGDS